MCILALVAFWGGCACLIWQTTIEKADLWKWLTPLVRCVHVLYYSLLLFGHTILQIYLLIMKEYRNLFKQTEWKTDKKCFYSIFTGTYNASLCKIFLFSFWEFISWYSKQLMNFQAWYNRWTENDSAVRTKKNEN